MSPKEQPSTVELGGDVDHLPEHVAIIMDGNGRWAQERGLPRLSGHAAGAGIVRGIVTECSRLRMKCLTLYSFSMDNWKRPPAEIKGLMKLYTEYLVTERPILMENNVRLVHLGVKDQLPSPMLQELNNSMEASKNNTGMVLALALNYSSREEMLRACRKLARQSVAGEIQPDQISMELFAQQLDTAGLPDPDLLIRTASERRISDFLLWQISYAELYVCDVHWPDFSPKELHKALKDFASRKRRFGGLNRS